MTKYVLNSGGLKNNIPGAKKFMAEMLRGLGSKPKVLFCFFAEKRENWEEKFPQYQEGFTKWAPKGVRPEFELAFPATFEEQIMKSDVIYIHGGDDHLVQYWLKKFDLPKIWEGKVIATNSASTHAVSAAYWTCDWREVGEGLGILPIKTLAHYKSSYGVDDPRGPIDWEKAKQELADYGDKSLPVYALEEGEFEVFEV
jgi:hypothetical protein